MILALWGSEINNQFWTEVKVSATWEGATKQEMHYENVYAGKIIQKVWWSAHCYAQAATAIPTSFSVDEG